MHAACQQAGLRPAGDDLGIERGSGQQLVELRDGQCVVTGLERLVGGLEPRVQRCLGSGIPVSRPRHRLGAARDAVAQGQLCHLIQHARDFIARACSLKERRELTGDQGYGGGYRCDLESLGQPGLGVNVHAGKQVASRACVHQVRKVP